MWTVLISVLLMTAAVILAIQVGRHWSEARQEGGAFWQKTKRGFWFAAIAMILAYANLIVQFAPLLMEAVGVEDVGFLLLLRDFSPFCLIFLLVPALYALSYRRTLRDWKDRVYADLDRVHWDTAYTRHWGNVVYRSQAVHAGFFGFLKSILEPGWRAPDEADRRPEDIRIAGRPGPLRQSVPPQGHAQEPTIHVWPSYNYYHPGRIAGGHSYHRAPSAPVGPSGAGGGFSGSGGRTSGAGAARSFSSFSGGGMRIGSGVSSLGSGLSRSASGGGFKSGGGKSSGSGAGRSFGQSAGLSAARAGAVVGMGTRPSGGTASSGSKSGSSGGKSKGKGGGGAVGGIGAAMAAALRFLLVFLLAVVLVAMALFGGYGTAWLLVNRQDRKHQFFRELDQMTRSHAKGLPAK